MCCIFTQFTIILFFFEAPVHVQKCAGCFDHSLTAFLVSGVGTALLHFQMPALFRLEEHVVLCSISLATKCTLIKSQDFFMLAELFGGRFSPLVCTTLTWDSGHIVVNMSIDLLPLQLAG